MNLKNSKILVFLMVMLSFSCAPIYIPSAHNVPQVENKGEAQVGAMVGSNGIDLQGSYALSDNKAVMLALSGPLATEDNDNRHFYVEGGYGIFNRQPSRLRMSTFAGFGFGAAHGESNLTVNGKPYDRTANGIYFKPFVQGNIGLHSKVVDVGLSSRFALVAFQYADIDGQEVNEPLSSLMIEPALYLNLGWDNFKISSYTGISISGQESIAFEYFPFMFGIGAQFMFNSQKAQQ